MNGAYSNSFVIILTFTSTIYSLIKMLFHMCKRSGLPPTWPQFEHAIKRNFGGLESEELNPLQEFEKQIIMTRELPDVPEEVCYLYNAVFICGTLLPEK